MCHEYSTKRLPIAQACQQFRFGEIRGQRPVDYLGQCLGGQNQHAVVICQHNVAWVYHNATASHRNVQLAFLATHQLGGQLSGAAGKYRQLASTKLVQIGYHTIDNDTGGTRTASGKLSHRTNARVGMITGHVDHQYIAGLQGDQGAVYRARIRFRQAQGYCTTDDSTPWDHGTDGVIEEPALQEMAECGEAHFTKLCGQ